MSGVLIQNLSLIYKNRVLFDNFTTKIPAGSKIVIIGHNGSGKTSLLEIIAGLKEPSSGSIQTLPNFNISYIPQDIYEFPELSGGQRFQKALTQALSKQPDLLILDEPTNHLDGVSHQNLLRLINACEGSILVATHDEDLLNQKFDQIWYFEHGKISVHNLTYQELLKYQESQNEAHELELYMLKKEQVKSKTLIQQESVRESHGRKKGKQENDRKLKGKMRETAPKTTSQKLARIYDTQDQLAKKLRLINTPQQIVKPKFNINPGFKKDIKLLIQNGTVGYFGKKPCARNLNISLSGPFRVAISGANGSGKTTILKALLANSEVVKSGFWQAPEVRLIGYMDQHYNLLNPDQSVFAHVKAKSGMNDHEVRVFLNNFLFSSNDQIQTLARNLSGGEKARLCLALLSCNPPSLLLLDEATNNLDFQSKSHLIEVLKAYPGSIIAISHEVSFLEEIGIEEYIEI